jgi:predicted ribonuclease YlaK
MAKKFLDTNSIISDCTDISNVLISSKTLEELENIKSSSHKDNDIKYKARVAVRAIREQKPEVVVVQKSDYDKIEELGLEVNNDNLIIASAWRYSQENPIVFLTHDVLCSLIANTYFGLDVEELKLKNDDVYKGYRVVQPTDEELSQVYSKDNCENIFGCLVNEYVIINDNDGNFCDVVKWNGEKYANIFNKNVKTMAFGDKLKAKDIYQRMAIDSLISNTMTCVSGKAGSGKSLLSLLVAMYLIETGKYDRLVVLFNPCQVRGATQMGYYQGSLTEKAMQSNIGNILITKFGDRFAVDNYIAQGKIKLIPMSDCRGMEILDTEILWITEAENTTIDLMKICLSRVSSGAKVFIEGDFDQTDNKLFDCNNGMMRAIEVLSGEKEFGYVQLQNVWRSRIAELTDKF